MTTVTEYQNQLPKDSDPVVPTNGKRKFNYSQEYGTTGTYITSGFINEEYLTKWKTLTNRVEVINKMLSSDGTIQAMWLAINLPIRSTNWFIKEDKKVDKKIKEHVEDCLFSGKMSSTWDSILYHALLHVVYGFSMLEEVYEKDPKTGYIIWKKIAPRLPQTLWKWKLDLNGGLIGVVQRAYWNFGDQTQVIQSFLPIEKLMLFVFQREGANWEGKSIFRAAYRHWFIKDTLYKIECIGLERMSIGIPVVQFGEDDPQEDVLEYMKKLVKSYRSYEEAGVLLPPGVTFDIPIGKINSGALQSAINHHDSRIAMATLTQFLNLGQAGRGGSRALSEDQSDLFLLCLNSVAKEIASVFNRFAIKRLVDFNFSNVTTYPELVFEEVGDRNSNTRKGLAGLLSQLISGRLLTPGPELEEYVRDLCKLPEMPKSVEEQYPVGGWPPPTNYNYTPPETDSGQPSELYSGGQVPGQAPEEIPQEEPDQGPNSEEQLNQLLESLIKPKSGQREVVQARDWSGAITFKFSDQEDQREMTIQDIFENKDVRESLPRSWKQDIVNLIPVVLGGYMKEDLIPEVQKLQQKRLEGKKLSEGIQYRDPETGQFVYRPKGVQYRDPETGQFVYRSEGIQFANPYRDPETGQFVYRPGGILTSATRRILSRRTKSQVRKRMKDEIYKVLKEKTGVRKDEDLNPALKTAGEIIAESVGDFASISLRRNWDQLEDIAFQKYVEQKRREEAGKLIKQEIVPNSLRKRKSTMKTVGKTKRIVAWYTTPQGQRIPIYKSDIRS